MSSRAHVAFVGGSPTSREAAQAALDAEFNDEEQPQGYRGKTEVALGWSDREGLWLVINATNRRYDNPSNMTTVDCVPAVVSALEKHGVPARPAVRSA